MEETTTTAPLETTISLPMGSNRADRLHGSQIRLLHLLPAEDHGAPLLARTEVVDVQKSPKFEAISYVWGDVDDTLPILVDNTEWAVTRNLEAALRIFRYKKKSRCIWADQICINQMDLVEKSHQVSCMGQTFAAATSVLCWLGPGDEDSEELVACFRAVKRFKPLLDRIDESFEERPGLQGADVANEIVEALFQQLQPKVASLTSRTHFILAMITFHEIPWFRRAWTLQEFCASRDFVFYLGSRTISAGEIHAVHNLLVFYGPNPLKPTPNAVVDEQHLASLTMRVRHRIMQIRQNYKMRYLRGIGAQIDLSRILIFNRDRQASNPRDKIYSVLSLIQSDTVTELNVDYSEPVGNLCRRTTKYVIAKTSRVDCLTMAFQSLPSPEWAQIPHWCVDWTFNQFRKGSIFAANIGHPFTPEVGYHVFSASGTSMVDVCVLQSCRIPDVLALKGFKVGTVLNHFELERYRYTMDSWSSDSHITQWLQQIIDEFDITSDCGDYLASRDQYAWFKRINGMTDLMLTMIENITHGRYRLAGEQIGSLILPHFLRWQNSNLNQNRPLSVLRELAQHISLCMEGRNLLLVRDIIGRKRLAVGPRWIQQDDVIACLFGGGTPYLVRDSPQPLEFEGRKYSTSQCLGECYANDLMHGEAMEWLKDVAEERKFYLT